MKHFLIALLLVTGISGCNAAAEKAGIPTKPIFDDTSRISIVTPALSGTAVPFDFNDGTLFVDIPDAAEYVVIAFFNSSNYYNSASRTIDWSKCIAGLRTNVSGYQNEQSIDLTVTEILAFSQTTKDFTGVTYPFSSGVVYYWAAWAIKDGSIAWSTPPWVNVQE